MEGMEDKEEKPQKPQITKAVLAGVGNMVMASFVGGNLDNALDYYPMFREKLFECGRIGQFLGTEVLPLESLRRTPFVTLWIPKTVLGCSAAVAAAVLIPAVRHMLSSSKEKQEQRPSFAENEQKKREASYGELPERLR
jgi:hypothetical protein